MDHGLFLLQGEGGFQYNINIKGVCAPNNYENEGLKSLYVGASLDYGEQVHRSI